MGADYSKYDTFKNLGIAILPLLLTNQILVDQNLQVSNNLEVIQPQVIEDLSFMQENTLIASQEIPISELAQKIIFCESGNRHDNIWGDNGKAYGIAQFWEGTFYGFAKKAGLQNADWKNKEQQIYLLEWALENNLGSHWTCLKKVV